MMQEIWSQNIMLTNKQNSKARKIDMIAIANQQLGIRKLTEHYIANRQEDSAVAIHTVDALLNEMIQSVRTTGENIDQEEYEMLLSVVTDTIVYPRAVMIHTCDTSLANGAVM